MAAAAIEPISPELVLVCPELRQQALGAAPPVWHPVRAESPARLATTPVESPRGLPSAVAVALLVPLVPIFLTFGFVLFVTTVLTIVSDAVH